MFLFISHRAYRSDLLQGEYIKYLSGKYRVIVFISGSTRSYYQSENVEYRQFPVSAGRFWSLFDSFLRPYLIRRFDYLPGVQFRHARYAGNDRVKNFLRALSFLLPKSFFSPSFFFWLETRFVPALGLFRRWVRQYQPVLILTATPGLSFMEAWAILCAKKLKISSAAVNFSWDNLTVYPRTIRPTDYLICWNEVIRQEAVALHGFDEKWVFVSGIMRYDHFFRNDSLGARDEFLINKGLDPAKKTILVATATDPDPDLHRRVVRWLRELAVNILIRVHPLERLSHYEEFFGQPGICVELAGSAKQSDETRGWQVELEESDRLNVKRIFSFCDLNINRSSTITIDSLIFGLPAINLDFGTSPVPIVTFPHYRPLIESGAVRLAHNRDELLKFATMYLANPLIDQKARRQIVDRLVPFRDGLAYKRNVDFLSEIIK